jgi:hypothetical protein
MSETSTVALLTVRAWREEGSSNPWRLEIGMTTNVSLGLQAVWTVSTRAQVVDSVNAFLDDAMATA